MAGLIRREVFNSAPAFSFGDVEREGRARLAAAQRAADELLAGARAQAEHEGAQIRAAAHAEGLAAGRQEGLEAVRREARQAALKDARKQLDQLTETLLGALRQYDQQRHALLAQAETGLLRLALEVARRVCKHEVGRSSETVVANVRALLDLVRRDDDLVLHVHPDDLDACRAALDGWIERVSELKHVEILAEPAADRGACALLTRSGRLDASVGLQLERIALALLGETSPPGAAPETP